MNRDPLVPVLLASIAVIVYATLYPFHFSSTPGEILIWTKTEFPFHTLDVIVNLFFFLPSGLIAGCRFRKKGSMIFIVLAAFFLSASVETAQAFIVGRYSSLRDVFLNVVGAFLGALLAHLPMFDPPVFRSKLSPLLEDRGRRILMLLLLAYQFFPFLPAIRRSRLREIVGQWQHLDLFQFVVLEQFALAIFVSSLWTSTPHRKVPIVLLALAPAQLLLVNREPRLAEVLGLSIGYALSISLAVMKFKIPHHKLAMLSVAIMGFKELRPFHWHLEAINGFNWVPFQAVLSIGPSEGFRIVCLKTFVYWFTIRQICLASGWRASVVSASAALLVLAFELVQMHIPGRTPESTDALICLMGGLLFLELDKSSDDQGL
jgi:VanZ family protein